MNVVASYRLLIPAVKNLRLIACMVTLLACSPLLQAQTNEETDTALIEPPVADTAYDIGTNNIDTKIGTTRLPEPLQYRAVPDSTVRRYKNQKDFEYANDPAYWDLEHEQELKRKREQEEREWERRQKEGAQEKKGFWDHFNNFFSSDATRIITYFVLGLFFLFVIYRIMVVNKLSLFYTSQKTKVSDGGEEVDIEDENLDEKVRRAAEAGDHRQAVRFMYLKTLQLLNERQWIKYHVDATNYEYVLQMSKHKLGNDFSFLTRIYDYVWYGEFTLTREQFDIVYNNFSHFYNAV
ncbi:MAG: DUF4129 domain-containing protein [Niastella sp.]|uniref:DUF4129 domain-containing protein n=1 Tax=Niastella sp. TaxID=1869183 RepID=UPI003899E241